MEPIKINSTTFNAIAIRLDIQKAFILSHLSNSNIPGENKPGAMLRAGELKEKYPWIENPEKHLKALERKGVLYVVENDTIKLFNGQGYAINEGNLNKIIMANNDGLKSIYAMRIYELITRNVKNDVLVGQDIAISFLIDMPIVRKMTDTTNKFARYSQFKTKVLDTAIKEINLKTNYHVGYTEIKTGKMVTGFKFEVSRQESQNICA